MAELSEEMILECWDMVQPTSRELDGMCDAADRGHIDRAVEISNGFWSRIFGEREN